MDKNIPTTIPQNYIYDTSYVKALVKNYADNQWQFINAVFAKDDIKDARSVWLDLNALQGFINAIQTPNPAGTTPNGVRIYFGAFSTDDPHPDTTDYNRLHTVIMLPTHSAADGKNYDYDAITGSSNFANLTNIAVLERGALNPPPYSTSGPNNMYTQGDLFMDYADNY